MRRWLAEVRSSRTLAHVVPLAAFLLLLIPRDLIAVENSLLPWWRQAPEHWLYPLQSILCLCILAFFWRRYQFRPFRGFGWALVLGALTIAVWILPSLAYGWLDIDEPEGATWWRWIGVAARRDGFDPTLFDGHPAPYYASTVFLRFVRMVVVVPLVEEIFWRGFLMRYLVDTDRPFWKIPFGTYAFRAVAITTGVFMLAHAPVDWLGALVFGLAMAWLAIRTKSLAACVLMHAFANLLLGLYVMATGSWGFW
ncbi:CAAX prenyl protease-related protein [soil metagenome]